MGRPRAPVVAAPAHPQSAPQSRQVLGSLQPRQDTRPCAAQAHHPGGRAEGAGTPAASATPLCGTAAVSRSMQQHATPPSQSRAGGLPASARTARASMGAPSRPRAPPTITLPSARCHGRTRMLRDRAGVLKLKHPRPHRHPLRRHQQRSLLPSPCRCHGRRAPPLHPLHPTRAAVQQQICLHQ